MLAIPLGLRGGLIHFPWATVAIVIGTTMYSLTHLKVSHESSRHRLQAPEGKALHVASLRLLGGACAELGLKREACAKAIELFEQPMSIYIGSNWSRLREAADPGQAKKIMRLLAAQDGWEDLPPQTRSSAPYLDFVDARTKFENMMTGYYRERHLLARDSMGPWTVLRGNLLHGGFMHLFANLLVFALLAIPVERRFGPLAFLVMYFAGGSLGLAGWAIFQPPQIFILGASGAVFAVAGAFATFFWRQRMRVWISLFFVYNKVIYMPAKYFFPLLLLARELGSAVSPNSTGVAHGAHILGFAAGAGLAWLHKRKWPLAEGFVDHKEWDQVQAAVAEADPLKRLRLLLMILDEHCENGTARTAAFMTAVRVSEIKPDSGALGIFLERHFNDEFEFLLHESPERQLEWLRKLPVAWNLLTLVKSASPGLLLKTGDGAARAGEWFAALRIYDLYLTLHKTSVRAVAVRNTVMSLINYGLENEISARRELSVYFAACPGSAVINEIRPMVAGVGGDNEAA